MGKKKIIGDMLLNIFAAFIPIVVLQVFIFPVVANEISAEKYGLLLAIYSLISIIPGTVGTTLNNIRLLHNNEYRKYEYVGDFNILVIAGTIINSVLMIWGTWYLEEQFNMFNIAIILLISILYFGHDYLIVEFRIKLNYKFILYVKLFQAVGYLIGMAIFLFVVSIWQFIFFFGYLIPFIFLLFKTNIWREKPTFTPLFRKVSKEASFLLIGTSLLRITSYADRLLLFPLLGGTAVSIYFVATIISKMTSMIFTPINSVALSYLTRIDNKPTSLFWKVILFGFSICFIAYFVIIIISKPVLVLLYPNFAEAAIELIYVTTATTVVQVLISLIQPFILRFNSMKFQIFINLSDVILYTLLSLAFLSLYGLIGFCFGILISRILKFIIMLLIFYIPMKEI